MRSMPASRPDALPVKAENLAKADLRKAEMPFRARVGGAIGRARELRGWSLKELAGKLDRDPRQVARWEDGTERPHLDALFALKEFQQPLVIALAELVHVGVEIDTVIRLHMRETA